MTFAVVESSLEVLGSTYRCLHSLFLEEFLPVKDRFLVFISDPWLEYLYSRGIKGVNGNYNGKIA